MEDRLSAIAQLYRSSAFYGGAALLPPLSIHIVTMGCAKNEVDSKNMAQLLMQAGGVIVEDPLDAECIIVNTCSFIQAATEESLEAIFDMCGLKNVKAGLAKVVVAGCMPARYGEELQMSLDEVKTFIPCSKEDDIVSLLDDIFPHRLGTGQLSLPMGELSAYIKISEGCDRFCSFCTIPFIRGRYKSFSFGRVNADVSRAISAGAKEIVLIAQDTGRWGKDFKNPIELADLLDALAVKNSDTWFRVMYIQPEGISEKLLDVIARHKNIASYLDIPFQHVSSNILAAMNRKGSKSDYLALIALIRKRVPGIVLRTTLMVGFPGETQHNFEELCDFVEEADLDYVGIFAYSQEEGTRAARLPSQVDEDEKTERFNILRDIADSVSALHISSRIGSTYDVLVLDREEDGQLYGRAQCQAPEVDGVVYLSTGAIGSIIPVTITDTLGYEMEGE